ncbi:MAG TPA: hypothetical protein VM370_01215 [Candidatus Thermoplasmatota archaeon]|nr:hypothetical protein [Candidatus Thermoplasmatota archaeon]
MPSLDQLLSRVVERKGFHVQGADKEALFAKKGDDTLLAAWKTDAPLTGDDARIFLAAFEQVHATSGILVCPLGADQPAKDALAANKGIELWAESRLVIEVGDALVKDALAGPQAGAIPATPPASPASAAPKAPTKFPSLISQGATAASGSGHGIAYYMPNKKKEQPIDMQGGIGQGRGGSLNYAWGGMTGGSPSAPGVATRLPSKPTVKTDQWGNVVKGAATTAPAVVDTGDVEITSAPRGGGRRVANPAATGAAPPVVVDADAEAYEIITTKKEKAAPVMRDAPAAPACSTLKLNVSKEEAASKVRGTVKLALVPHVAFQFDLQMSRPGMPAPMTAKGAILVNSLTGDLRAVDALEFAASEPADARKDAEKMTAVDVYDKVKGHMAKTYTKTLNVEREVAGNTVMESLKLTPEPDEMNLQHRGVVHVPVWEITTSTGVTRIDAYTGAQL